MSGLGHTFHLESAALDGMALDVHRVEGSEALNRPWRFRVSFWTPEASLARTHREDLLEQPIALFLVHRNVEVRRFRGVVAELTERSLPGTSKAAVELTIVPRFAQLERSRKTQFFLERSIPDIVEETLVSWGLLSNQDFVMSLAESYPILEFVTQHQESDLDFVSRLCEHVGIAFWFEERGDREVLVFSDRAEAFQPIARPDALRYGTRESDHTAFEITRALRRRPARVIVHDYNYRAPALDLLAETPILKPGSEGPWVEYGIHAKTPDESKRFAQIRSEEEAWTHQLVLGKTNETRLRAGCRFRLVDQNADEEELAVVELNHHFDQGRAGGSAHAYNEFRAIPIEVRYRPLRTTPKPRIAGLVHAVVDGAIKGDYSEIDEVGRYNVRFRFDRSGRTDLHASRPVRMLQPHSGARYGMHFPLRPGAEVFVGFVEGDPDRPMIVGAVPNPVTPSPVDRSNQTENVLRSGSNNELIMEDLRGRERVRLHSPLHATTLQLGSWQEPEEGALLKTDAHISLFARESIASVMSRATSLMNQLTTLVGDSAVMVAGIPALSEVRGPVRSYDDLVTRMSGVRAQLEYLATPHSAASSGAPPEGEPDPAPCGRSNGTFSGLGASLSDGATGMAMDASERMAKQADENATASQGRSCGQTLLPLGTPRLVLGALSNATLFARDTTLVHGDRSAVLSSDDTTRVVGASKVDIQSPEQVEVAGARSVQISSSNFVDLYGRQLSLFAVEDPGKIQDPLSPEVSMALLAEKDLRIKSGTAAIRACAEQDFVIHSHQANVRVVAKGSIVASGGAIEGSAGTIVLKSNGDIAIESVGDTTLEAANVTIEAATVTIRAGTITLDVFLKKKKLQIRVVVLRKSDGGDPCKSTAEILRHIDRASEVFGRFGVLLYTFVSTEAKSQLDARHVKSSTTEYLEIDPSTLLNKDGDFDREGCERAVRNHFPQTGPFLDVFYALKIRDKPDPEPDGICFTIPRDGVQASGVPPVLNGTTRIRASADANTLAHELTHHVANKEKKILLPNAMGIGEPHTISHFLEPSSVNAVGRRLFVDRCVIADGDLMTPASVRLWDQPDADGFLWVPSALGSGYLEDVP